MSEMDLAVSAPISFQFKGGMTTLTSIVLMSDDLDLFHNQLSHKIKQAPRFFKNAPVIIDCQKLKGDTDLDFDRLRFILSENALIPVGVKGCRDTLANNAIECGFALLADTSSTSAIPPSKAKASVKAIPQAANKLITSPVRSGQQIYARGGDLIVLAPVSNGAELLADGNIHVYAPLRGRALAGINGDKDVRIFCHCLEAELISIAGQYRLSEDLKDGLWKVSVQVYLADDQLHVEAI